MGSADDRPDRSHLVVLVLGSAVLFGGIGAATAGLRHESRLTSAGVWGLWGAAAGAAWYWRSRRATAFRSSFELASQTLTRPERTIAGGPPTAPARRYRNRPALALYAGLGALYLIFALVVTILAEPPPGPLAVLWSPLLLSASLLAATWLTYLDIGPDGLRVRTPRRRHTIAWSDLAEVRLVRRDSHDALMLTTTDGREIRTEAVRVADTGLGHTRAARAFADLEQAWRASSTVDE